MQESDAQVGKDFLAQLFVHFVGGFERVFFVLFDHGIDDVGLVSGGYLLAHKLPDFIRPVIGHAASNDWGSSRRHFVDHADVEVAVEGQGQSPWDGGGGHHQDIGLGLNC